MTDRVLSTGSRLLHARADRSIVDSMQALLRRDLVLARGVCEGDAAVNELRYEIEETVLNLIALQHPVAGDLRELIALNSIASNLERIADHAEGIARIAIFLEDNPFAATEPDLWRMSDLVREMLRNATRSFIDRDEALARATCDQDEPWSTTSTPSCTATSSPASAASTATRPRSTPSPTCSGAATTSSASATAPPTSANAPSSSSPAASKRSTSPSTNRLTRRQDHVPPPPPIPSPPAERGEMSRSDRGGLPRSRG